MIKPLKVLTIALPLLALTPLAHAMDMKPKDDKVVFNLSAEDWVTTETARVDLRVEAAVTQKTAGSMRKQMINAVNSVVKADWRLTNFYRHQDSTGMERWSATFQARLPEVVLSGLNEQAKKQSKAGMQIKVNNIDFSPTLAEREAVKSKLRTKIYKNTQIQLDELNKALPSRAYRISIINFSSRVPHLARGRHRAKNKAMMETVSSAPAPSMERSEKITMNARIVLATQPKNKTVQ